MSLWHSSPICVAHHGDEEVDQENCHNHDEHQEFHLKNDQNMLEIVTEYAGHKGMAGVRENPPDVLGN